MIKCPGFRSLYNTQASQLTFQFLPLFVPSSGSTAVILTMIVLAVVLNSQLMAGERKIKRGQEETSVRI